MRAGMPDNSLSAQSLKLFDTRPDSQKKLRGIIYLCDYTYPIFRGPVTVTVAILVEPVLKVSVLIQLTFTVLFGAMRYWRNIC